jgi:uncharacterized protein
MLQKESPLRRQRLRTRRNPPARKTAGVPSGPYSQNNGLVEVWARPTELHYNGLVKRFGQPISDDLEARLERLAQRLAREEGVAALYLVGSRALGEAGPLSDVDVALLLDPPDGPSQDVLVGLAQEILGTDEVGLIVLNRAPLAVAAMVLRGARVLLSRDDARRVDYEQRIHHRYLDLKHYLRAYDRELFRQVAEWGRS